MSLIIKLVLEALIINYQSIYKYMNFFNMLELDQSSTLKKILSIMKLTVVFLIAFSLQISASVYSQTTKLSLNVQNQSIKDVLYLIENQTDF